MDNKEPIRTGDIGLAKDNTINVGLPPQAVVNLVVAVLVFALLVITAIAYLIFQSRGQTTHGEPTANAQSPMLPLGVGARQVSLADGMVLVYVPAGSFLMGSTDSDPNAQTYEMPQHTVQLDAFWIDQTDVTNAEFAKFVQATWYQTEAELWGGGVVCAKNGVYYQCGFTRGANWEHPWGLGSNLDGRSERPVVQVSWNDAHNYCAWAGRRLPTEAEWEKAARGIDGRLYPWGNGAPNDTLLNYNHLVGDTTAVGSYSAGASPYGAMDMAGNVDQWVADWYSDSYYSQSSATNPTGPASGQYRVLKGGSWSNVALGIRATMRNSLPQDVRQHDTGFRCAR